MDTQTSQGTSAVDRLLTVAEYFLRNRDLDGCRKYALRAQESNPHLPGVAQILAVADVLAAETCIVDAQPDWYAILKVNRYSKDSQSIRDSFKNLILLLNPNSNKFSYADHALELVRDAFSVLSNPIKKYQFDNELKLHYGDMEFQNSDTFWTICPYCYYVYEYAGVYKECCLRCQNEKCMRGFHAVAVPKPPIEVVENGQYRCMGFFPLGFDGGDGKGFSPWTPFAPMFMDVKEKNSMPEDDNLVEISDDSDSSDSEIASRNAGNFVNANAKKVQTEEVKQRDDGIHGNWKPVMKRKKKTVPKTSKKVMGKGTRIKKPETVPQSSDGLDLNADASEDEEDDIGSEFVGGLEMGSGGDFVLGGVQFYEGDDDVFVGLQDGF